MEQKTLEWVPDSIEGFEKQNSERDRRQKKADHEQIVGLKILHLPNDLNKVGRDHLYNRFKQLFQQCRQRQSCKANSTKIRDRKDLAGDGGRRSVLKPLQHLVATAMTKSAIS